ncbi:hypothetical protein OIU34_17190 [Pararhizobium sp. BT-229]|uniref:hypothetical protein n=1 Tax=Pararhizobium sp. BT-229 TaxID=2986923 RepID=UPI0021F6A8AD|nr:hypothetical protein [Pararhizobium sp. BT-229]MCV9963637.1 hypothetical protein [Pararhizobium sp. BT-229]
MPTIEFEVPYLFEATFVPRGKRKPVDGTFGGLMKVEIECATSAEAALVVTVTGNDGFRDRFERKIVEFDGGFFERSTADDEVRIADFSASCLNHYNSYDLARFEAGTITERPDGEFYSIEGNYHEERGWAAVEAKKDEVREAAKSVLFVDGVLHRRTTLPTIKAGIEYRMRGSNVIHVRLGESDERTGAHGMMFAIGELTAADAWAQDRVAREPQETVIYKDIDVEVHLPHLLPKTDIMKSEMIRIGQFLLDHDIDLKKQSNAVILHWIAARDALHDAVITRDEVEITHMLETWEKFYKVYAVSENERCNSFNSSFDLDDDIHYKALMGATEVWENRLILDPETTFGTPSPKIAP